ncbi:hypothetical protein Bp8pS_305 [Bacillus phage vB_BpuM-BpSp]|nr:hypothetical protein Bp8pS_305 [Bacillus phage vB_BpuM-BpSp]
MMEGIMDFKAQKQIRSHINGLIRQQHVPEDFLREFSQFINWVLVSNYQNLSEDFIEEYADKVDWSGIASKQNISLSFISRNLDRFEISDFQFFKINNHLDKDSINKIETLLKINSI